MAKIDQESKNNPAPPIAINTETILGTQYSQVASITISDLDITLDFVYVNPQTKKGIVVSRVTMPKVSGEQLANLILQTIKQHIKKQEQEKK